MNGPEPILPPPAGAPVSTGYASVVRMLGVFFTGLRILIVAALACMVFGGFFSVKESEVAMIFRFGRLHAVNGQEVLRSGDWYWHWPYPIDEKVVWPAQRSITVTTEQFAPRLDANRLKSMQQEAPPPEGAQPLRPGQDGYLLTGDANIMHMAWTLTYRVTDAKRYYLGFAEDPKPQPNAPKDAPKSDRRGVETLIRSALEDAVIQEAGIRPVEDVFRPGGTAAAVAAGREGLTDAVRARVVKTLEGLDVGIEVQQVSLVEVQPPVAVQLAFRDVLNAATDKDTDVRKALAYEKRVVTEAEGRASQVLSDARAYRTRVAESVKASAAYFETVRAEYEKNPDTMLVSLYADTMREILAKAETKYILHAAAPGAGQEVRLLLGPEPEKPRTAAPEGGAR